VLLVEDVSRRAEKAGELFRRVCWRDQTHLHWPVLYRECARRAMGAESCGKPEKRCCLTPFTICLDKAHIDVA